MARGYMRSSSRGRPTTRITRAEKARRGAASRSRQVAHSISARATARSKNRSRGRTRWKLELSKKWSKSTAARTRRQLASRARLGRVAGADGQGNPRVQGDGEQGASRRGFGQLHSYSAANPPQAGDRVMLRRQGKDWLVAGKVIQN